MEKIELANGSIIEIVEEDSDVVRSRRWEAYLQYLRTNPIQYYEETFGVKLRWHQKLILKNMANIQKIKNILRLNKSL